MVSVLFALLTALFNGLASVLQRMAASTAPAAKTLHLSLFTYLFKHKVWLAGIGMVVLAIVLGIAQGPGDGSIFGTTGASANISSFAEARQSGVYSVAGSARAALTLSFDLSDFLTNMSAHIPIPLGGSRPVQAALSLEAGGRLSARC